MQTHEYRTIELPFKAGFVTLKTPDLETHLNGTAIEGWRLQQVVVTATSNFGQSNKLIAILERPVKGR